MADDKQTFRCGIHKAEDRAGLSDMTAEVSVAGAGMAAQVIQLTRGSLPGFGGAVDASLSMMNTLQDLSREMASIVEDGFRHQMDGIATLSSCRTMPELMAAQAALAKQTLEKAAETHRRLADIVLRSSQSVTTGSLKAAKSAVTADKAA